VGEYIFEPMEAELAGFLGRESYEKQESQSNHRNGSVE